MFKRLRSLFRVLTRRREFEDGMSEELRFHIEQYTDDLVRSGMSRKKAARQIRMELGSPTNIKADCREAFGLHLFDEFSRELSYAARLLRKTPGFTATALLTLAVCFGANLTIFAVIETTLLTVGGGLLGLAVGAGGIHLLRVLGADRLPLGGRIAFDARLALVALFAAILMGIVLAAPIAWFNLRRHLGNALQSESRGGTSGRAAQMLRHGFIVSQIALAFMLLAGAGLLGLSLQRVVAVSPGFQSDHVLTGQILLPWADYPDGTARLTFVESLIDKTGRSPTRRSPSTNSTLSTR
jgi:uncharacterized membrane protein